MRTREVAGLIRMHRYFMGAQRQPPASFPWYRTNFSRAGTNSGLEQAKQASALPCQSCWCHADLFCVTRAWNVSHQGHPWPPCHFNWWAHLCLHVTWLFRIRHIQHSWLFPSSWSTCSSRLWTAQWPVSLLLHWSLCLVSWLNSPFLSDH